MVCESPGGRFSLGDGIRVFGGQNETRGCFLGGGGIGGRGVWGCGKELGGGGRKLGGAEGWDNGKGCGVIGRGPGGRVGAGASVRPTFSHPMRVPSSGGSCPTKGVHVPQERKEAGHAPRPAFSRG